MTSMESSLVDGTWRLIKRLNAGGPTELWEAVDAVSGERVALKLLPESDVRDLETLELFARQERILASLDHPALPKPRRLTRASVDGRPMRLFALDFIDGESIAALVERGGRVDETRARAILDQLLEVLEYLHIRTPAIIHRDVKPSNVILRPDGSIALVDFDTARGHAPDPHIGDKTIVASAGYVPPEQLLGRSQPASDQYAAACTMLFLLSHIHPMEIPLRDGRLAFEPFIDVSPTFAAVLRRMVAPDPAHRFSSAAEARRALAGEVPAEVDAPRPVATAVHRLEQWLRSHSRLHLAGGALFGGVLLAVSVLAIRRGEHPVDFVWNSGPGTSTPARIEMPYLPTASYLIEARAWKPNREELAAHEVRWAKRVVESAGDPGGKKGMMNLLGPPDGVLSGNNSSGIFTPPKGVSHVTVDFGPLDRPVVAVLIREELATGAVTRVDLIGKTSNNDALLWQGRLSDSIGGYQFLRLDLPSPRSYDRVRVCFDVTEANWRENPIDAIGVILAPEEGSPAEVASSAGGASEWNPAEGLPPNQRLLYASRVLARDERVDDVGSSGILGPPDIHPRHQSGDGKKAWNTIQVPPGRRWIALGFDVKRPSRVRSLLIWETYHPGSVIRVDDLTGQTVRRGVEPAVTSVLWQGHVPGTYQDYQPRSTTVTSKEATYPCWSDRARVLRIDLAVPRPIEAIRVIADTNHGCYSELDAVALLVEEEDPIP